MRTYPSNSPQAAARIVALAMLDGNVAPSESAVPAAAVEHWGPQRSVPSRLALVGAQHA